MTKIIKEHFIIILIFLTLLYLIFGSMVGLYIPCVFESLTGFYCPGCGVTRMIKSIFRLDFYQAFRYNPLLFIFTPFILFILINYIYCSFKKKKSIFEKLPRWFCNMLLIITIAYWVLRNLIPYLAPTVV